MRTGRGTWGEVVVSTAHRRRRSAVRGSQESGSGGRGGPWQRPPRLERLVVGARQEEPAVFGEGDGADGARVCLDHRALALAAGEDKRGQGQGRGRPSGEGQSLRTPGPPRKEHRPGGFEKGRGPKGGGGGPTQWGATGGLCGPGSPRRSARSSGRRPRSTRGPARRGKSRGRVDPCEGECEETSAGEGTRTPSLSHTTHLVAREAVGAQLRLEVPDHDCLVEPARDELLHVGVEHHAGDGILVPAERPLKDRVLALPREKTKGKEERERWGRRHGVATRGGRRGMGWQACEGGGGGGEMQRCWRGGAGAAQGQLKVSAGAKSSRAAEARARWEREWAAGGGGTNVGLAHRVKMSHRYRVSGGRARVRRNGQHRRCLKGEIIGGKSLVPSLQLPSSPACCHSGPGCTPPSPRGRPLWPLLEGMAPPRPPPALAPRACLGPPPRQPRRPCRGGPARPSRRRLRSQGRA